MASLDAALKTYEVLTALHALPDQAALTTAEAALFLRLSPKSLERMRADGSGPPYLQAGARGARGGNQKCLYLKSSLLAWQLANQISNAMEAAVRKGQAFKTIFDLVADAPFYLDANGRVAGAAEDISLSVIIERLGSDVWSLLWLPVVEAAGQEWADLAAHQDLAREIQSILAVAEQKISAALEASGIGSAVALRH
ncbi:MULTISPECIES: helix-turn-helix domain-containing protein [Burkholderia]|uniref:helix-turn-helix domain-containing protein n=1 Tax=Burkholderia TaxID=32008 RepID=UPI00163FEC19|nr:MULTISPECIES: helix-turn-helix domain-containing protein [Burkholderia]MCM2538729.1 helix-turn-helix domain-containing protein [Burkholderia glumae]